MEVSGGVPWSPPDEKRKKVWYWDDRDDSCLRRYLSKVYHVKGRDVINDALNVTLRENHYHPVRDYLNSLVWDGTERVDTLLIKYLGAEDNEYTRAVTRLTLMQAVGRILEPGTKVDTMLVLAGKQGSNKSEMVRRLGKPWMSDTLTVLKGKDAYEQLQGFWIIEMAELSAMRKTDVETIKHFISKREDSFRPAYARNVETFPRQCIFIGTTNTDDFLRDTSGNRRFYPVDVVKARAQANPWDDFTPTERDQVWAEAKVLWEAEMSKPGRDPDEGIYLADKRVQEMAEQVQRAHLEEDPRTGMVRDFLERGLPAGWWDCSLTDRRLYWQDEFKKAPADEADLTPRDRVCALEIWAECFGQDPEKITRRDSREIFEIMRTIEGWETGHIRKQSGPMYPRGKGFIRKSHTGII